MFKNNLRIGAGSDVTGRRRTRKIKPSLENLDVRIAPSGASPLYVLQGDPTPPPSGHITPMYVLRRGDPSPPKSGHFEPMFVVKGGHPGPPKSGHFEPMFVVKGGHPSPPTSPNPSPM